MQNDSEKLTAGNGHAMADCRRVGRGRKPQRARFEPGRRQGPLVAPSILVFITCALPGE
jgi:hypothetical protein